MADEGPHGRQGGWWYDFVAVSLFFSVFPNMTFSCLPAGGSTILTAVSRNLSGRPVAPVRHDISRDCSGSDGSSQGDFPFWDTGETTWRTPHDGGPPYQAGECSSLGWEGAGAPPDPEPIRLSPSLGIYPYNREMPINLRFQAAIRPNR